MVLECPKEVAGRFKRIVADSSAASFESTAYVSYHVSRFL